MDRIDAGRRLAAALTHLRGQDLVILGVLHGGVAVAAEVARELEAPLDVILVRKVRLPWQPALIIGTVGAVGSSVVDSADVRLSGRGSGEFYAAQARTRAEVQRELRALRGDRPPAELSGRTAILVVDGIATGCTARAACRVVRSQGAARVVLAAPVGPRDTVQALSFVADEVVCVRRPLAVRAISEFCEDRTSGPSDGAQRCRMMPDIPELSSSEVEHATNIFGARRHGTADPDHAHAGQGIGGTRRGHTRSRVHLCPGQAWHRGLS